MKRKQSSFACEGFHAARPSRRAILRVGGMGLLGLTMPRMLKASAEQAWASGSLKTVAPRAKSVIFLYQFGGPSHIDMFDMKPNAPQAIRSPHKPISSSVDGIQVSEHLPRVAKIMDKVTLIRSMTHTMKNHNSASYYALSGHAPPVDDIRLKDTLDLFPAYGSVVDALAPSRGDMPTFVSYPYLIRDGSVTPGQHGSFLGKSHDPFFFSQDPNSPDFALPELNLPEGTSIGRLESRRELQQMIDQQSHMLDHAAAAEGLDEYYSKALAMLNSTRLRKAFNISAESDKLRDAYGRHTYGQSLLLARRLVEAEAKFITVYFSDGIGGQSFTSGGWDTHGFQNTHMFPIIEKYHLPITDQTLPTLLTDLDERGLLDTTLVIWMGEFGRTPRLNAQNSRDHWPQCYTVLLAGGGVKRGFVYGASDKHAEYPAKDPVRPDDLAATMYHLLGIDPATEVHAIGNRPVAISEGQPLMDVLA
jgi:hypothetical protein